MSQFSYLRLLGMVAEKEAKRKRSKALADLIKNGPRAFDPRRITFGEWLERWIDSLAGTVAENTWGFYEHRARTYLKPALGKVKLPELTAEHLDGLYRDLLARGKGTPSGRALAPSTVDQIHSTARVALGRAAKKRLIPHNVARDADAPKVEKKERTTLDLDGLGCFFAAAAGERLEGLWIVWCLTGLRPGEILGLKWADVRLPEDGSDGELLIRPSWSATRTGAVMRETTKTGKGRPVSLLSEATAAMSAHRMRYLEELVRYRDLVFPSRAGTPLDHGNVNRQQFKKLLKKAGLLPMRPYDIRHSFATLWIESGESAEVLQKVLGHSSIATKINTYSHLSPRYQRESFGRFGGG